jgi:hypothetical protein
MGPYDVYYIKPKTGKHKFRTTHNSFLEAAKHSCNLSTYDINDYDGLFSYVVDKSTGLVAKGNKWEKFEIVFPNQKKPF